MILKHVGRSVVIFSSIPKSNFLRILDIFLDFLMQFLCSIMQWSAKSAFIVYSLHVYKLCSVDIQDLSI